MRLKSLDLKAFGPFTGQRLSFDSGEPGLHLIYGANEAGKSSALRGLKALLYGFHSQTPDNFVHPYEQLLVGGCLENRDGGELCFQRRKRRVGDLLDGAGNLLEAASLAAFLQGVEPQIFESLYGIDHRRLVEGGAEILSQKGEVGQALFAAGAGLSSLQTVIDQLDREAAALFKPAGQLPLINRAVTRFRELKKQVAEASLSARDWKELREALTEAESRLGSLEQEREQKNGKLRRLERLQQAIPELGALQVWRERLQALGEVTLLPSDFGENYRRLDELIRDTRSRLHDSAGKLRQLEDKRRAIALNTALLEQAEVVDDFQQRLGEYRKGQKDRPERNGMRIGLRQEAAQLLRQVRPDLGLEEVESLRPVLTRKKTIHTLSGRFEALSQQLRQAGKQTEAAELEMAEVGRVRAGLPEVPDAQELAQAVRLARQAGDLDARIARQSDEAGLVAGECRAELKRIGLWSGDLAELPELALPLHRTVHVFEQKFKAIADIRQKLDNERRDGAEELEAVQAEISRITLIRELPSEEELGRTRQQRDEGWRLLRRQWLEGEDVSEESRALDHQRSLPAAYEGLVERADLLADRLRHEADRVAAAAGLRSRMEALKRALAEHDRAETALRAREEAVAGAWSAVWQPAAIDPLTPLEMAEWLTAMDRLRFRVNDLLKIEEELGREEGRRELLRTRLRQGIEAAGGEGGPAGGELGPLLAFSESLLETLEKRRRQLQQLQEKEKELAVKLAQARRDLAEARESLVDWQARWQKAIAGLGLAADISPPEAHDYLDTLQSCLTKVREADDLQKRIDGIDRDAGEFGREVAELLRRVAGGGLSLPVDQAVLNLRTALDQARRDQTRHDQLGEDILNLRSEVALLKKRLADADVQMADLLTIAGCERPDEAAAIIDRFHQHQQICKSIETIEGTLARIGGGAAVGELTEQAAAVDADQLPGQIAALRQDIDQNLNPAIIQISREIGEIGSRLTLMDGSARAADAREEMEQELTGIRRLAQQYLTVKLAARILQQEIERYREEHQGPVLSIASRHFAGLTLNSFRELKVDVDDRGEPVLVGIRLDGRATGVDGMSDGTRDQLYLALRLATLEWRLEKSEPMPFIVDDILVNFDDERSRAALTALAQLSRKNQVILFTHHRRIVDQAESLNTPAEVVVHRLGA